MPHPCLNAICDGGTRRYEATPFCDIQGPLRRATMIYPQIMIVGFGWRIAVRVGAGHHPPGASATGKGR